jgi:hypothetical protein
MYVSSPEDELTNGLVFRLAKVTNSFPRESKKALPGHFAFSDAERRDGKWLLSVWDRERTTPDQARAIMRNPKDERIAFGIQVDDIRTIDVRGHHLSVLRDPLPPDFSGHGRNGHCGIAGLHCEAKDDRRQLRFLLSEAAKMRLD